MMYFLAALVQLTKSIKERNDTATTTVDDIETRIKENNEEISGVIKEINAVFKDMNSL